MRGASAAGAAADVVAMDALVADVACTGVSFVARVFGGTCIDDAARGACGILTIEAGLGLRWNVRNSVEIFRAGWR